MAGARRPPDLVLLEGGSRSPSHAPSPAGPSLPPSGPALLTSGPSLLSQPSESRGQPLRRALRALDRFFTLVGDRSCCRRACRRVADERGGWAPGCAGERRMPGVEGDWRDRPTPLR